MGYMVSTNTYNKKLKYISLPSTFKNFASLTLHFATN